MTNAYTGGSEKVLEDGFTATGIKSSYYSATCYNWCYRDRTAWCFTRFYCSTGWYLRR